MRHKKPNRKNRRNTVSNQEIANSRNRAFGKSFKFAATGAAVMILMIFAAGSAIAGPGSPSGTQNVDVVNTPTVNVGNTPSVSISGTPTVNAAAIIAAPGPLTNVGRLA